METKKTSITPVIYLSDEEFDLINNSHNLPTSTGVVSVEIIKKILNDNECFAKVFDFFGSQSEKILFVYQKNNHTEKIISLKKYDIIYGIEKYFDECQFYKKEINELTKEKYNRLKNTISYTNLKKNCNQKYYDIVIDNINYHVSFNEIFKVLERVDFLELIENPNIKEINGIKKEHFAYLVRSLFTSEKLFANYVIPNRIHNNYNSMLEIIDLEAINMLSSTEDKLHREVIIDKSLESEILSSIPKDYSPLEKALYIYIKMCKLFNYDERFYVFNQQGEDAIKHQNISYLSSINLDNRDLVCYEFNMIFCYFLNKLGINFKSNYFKCNNENYGRCHVNSTFRYDKFILQADSTVNIIFSDMYYAKVNKKLTGIKCLNQNEKTQEEFNEILYKVYRGIQGEKEIIEDVSKLNVMDRLKYIYEKASSKKMSNLDCVSYFIDLYQNIFTEEEKENKIKLSLVRNNDRVNIVVTLNVFHFDCLSQNVYYVYIPNEIILPISYGNLQKMFDENIYTYINPARDTVPGIVLENEMYKTFVKRY